MLETDILCLPAPYGYPGGTAISIRAPKPITGEKVAGLALGFGCPPFIADRVSVCIEASERYDCRVTLDEQALFLLRHCLQEIGAELILPER